jgi:hypothetical protein
VSRLFNRERALFRTKRPPFRVPEWAVGSLVAHEGTLYRITRWRELPPVTFGRGGSAREWEVRGRKASGKEVQEELAKGAQSLLGEGEDAGDPEG